MPDIFVSITPANGWAAKEGVLVVFVSGNRHHISCLNQNEIYLKKQSEAITSLPQLYCIEYLYVESFFKLV